MYPSLFLLDFSTSNSNDKRTINSRLLQRYIQTGFKHTNYDSKEDDDGDLIEKRKGKGREGSYFLQ